MRKYVKCIGAFCGDASQIISKNGVKLGFNMTSSSSVSTVPAVTPQLDVAAFEKMSAWDRCEVITTVGSLVLLIVAVGLTINYALHPVAPMIPITSNFSMSLPLMVCSSAGFVMAITFVVQMIRHRQINVTFERGFGQLFHSSEFLRGQLRYALHPGGRSEGLTVAQYQEARQEVLENAENLVDGKMAFFPTRDGLQISGLWHFIDADAPTVILFHGNAMSAEDLAFTWGKYYKNLQFNVL